MNLISCDNCGVVLDKDKLNFPNDIWDEDGCVNEQLGTFDQNTKLWSAFIQCPLCEEKIIQ